MTAITLAAFSGSAVQAEDNQGEVRGIFSEVPLEYVVKVQKRAHGLDDMVIQLTNVSDHSLFIRTVDAPWLNEHSITLVFSTDLPPGEEPKTWTSEYRSEGPMAGTPKVVEIKPGEELAKPVPIGVWFDTVTAMRSKRPVRVNWSFCLRVYAADPEPRKDRLVTVQPPPQNVPYVISERIEGCLVLPQRTP